MSDAGLNLGGKYVSLIDCRVFRGTSGWIEDGIRCEVDSRSMLIMYRSVYGWGFDNRLKAGD
jgi:hypothetical protein